MLLYCYYEDITVRWVITNAPMYAIIIMYKCMYTYIQAEWVKKVICVGNIQD